MRVRMKHQISGTRDGVEWPAPGEEIDLPDDEAAAVCHTGMGEPVAEKKAPEKRPAAGKAETREGA
ncbi:hypothetical protein GCM10023403_10600 [Pseudonocardia benzenivorans]